MTVGNPYAARVSDFAAYGNRVVANQAVIDLKHAEASKAQVVTLEKVVQGPCVPDKIGEAPYPPAAECRGGTLLQRTATGWESITHNGRAIRCQ